MGSIDREERQTIRSIQQHLCATLRESVRAVEQLGTVDIYFHPSNPDPYLNCAIPRKGVAWVRQADLREAFEGLERLGRVPRLVYQDALFPGAFRHQIGLLGLTLEEERQVMIYRPLLGPHLPDEVPRGRLPAEYPPSVRAHVATERAELATWLRVFRAGYFNTEILTVDPDAVDALVKQAATRTRFFVLATYNHTPLGAARVAVRETTAEIETMVTAPFWHDMGLEIGLILAAVGEAEQRGARIIFIVAPPNQTPTLYLDLGFNTITSRITFWQAEQYASPPTTAAQDSAPTPQPDTQPDPTAATKDSTP